MPACRKCVLNTFRNRNRIKGYDTGSAGKLPAEDKMRRFILSGLALILVTVLGITSCKGRSKESPPGESSAAKLSFKLSWHHGVQFLGFYVAKRNGYYSDESIEITIVESKDSQELDALGGQIADGTYDIATDQVGLLLAQRRGLPLVAIANYLQFGPQTLFARRASGIKRPADLAGRTIAIKSQSWQHLVEILLKYDGLTLDDVQPVKSGYDMTPFYERKVEVWAGFLTNEVVRARMKGLDLVTLPFYEYGIRIKAGVIYVNWQTVQERSDELVRFLRASLRGWQWAVENPVEAVDIMLDLFPDMSTEREFHIASFEAYIPLIIPPGVELGTLNCDDWQDNPLFSDYEMKREPCTTEIWEAVLQN